MSEPRGGAPEPRPPIHASNAWNPTGQTLAPVPGCRLYYAHVDTLGGARTQVLLGSQRHLTFVADFEGHVAVEDIRQRVVDSGVYPHLADLEPASGLPRVHAASAERPWG